MRRSVLAVPAALVIALAGCAVAEPESSGVPSSTPSATASESPTPSPTATEEPVAEWPQCSDDYVFADNQAGIGQLAGTRDEVLAALAPRGEFAAPDALDGLDVLCVVTTTGYVDGAPAENGERQGVDISVALVAAEPLPDPVLQAWAAANGYEPSTGDEFAERVRPAEADGSSSKIVWVPMSSRGWDEAALAEQSALLGFELALDDRTVVFYDFAPLPG